MRYKKTGLILLIFLISLFTISINKKSSEISIMDFFTFDNIVLNNEKIEKNPFEEKYEKRYRFAILSYLVPHLLHKKGKIIGDYLSKNLGIKIVPIYSANYNSLGELMCAGKAEIVWGSPSLYSKIHKNSDYSINCKINSKNGGTYSSLFIVRKDSNYKTIEDLKGKTIAYVDPGSSSGFQIPNKFFASKKIDPKDFFSSIIFSGTHDIAAKFVIEGKADIATVYDNIMSIESSIIDTNEIRILSIAGTVSQAPILISNIINEADRKKINDLFINAKNYPGGKEFLQKLHDITKITGFIPATESEYLE